MSRRDSRDSRETRKAPTIRQKVPDVALEDLETQMRKHHKESAAEDPWDLQGYDRVAKSQAAQGLKLVKIKDILSMLLGVAPRGEIKFSMLKQAYVSVIRQLGTRRDVEKADEVAGGLTTALKHVRCLARTSQLLARCTQAMPVNKADALRELVKLCSLYSSDAEPSSAELLHSLTSLAAEFSPLRTPSKRTPSREERGRSSRRASLASSPGKRKRSSPAGVSAGQLLMQALAASPVPATKRNLHHVFNIQTLKERSKQKAKDAAKAKTAAKAAIPETSATAAACPNSNSSGSKAGAAATAAPGATAAAAKAKAKPRAKAKAVVEPQIAAAPKAKAKPQATPVRAANAAAPKPKAKAKAAPVPAATAEAPKAKATGRVKAKAAAKAGATKSRESQEAPGPAAKREAETAAEGLVKRSKTEAEAAAESGSPAAKETETAAEETAPITPTKERRQQHPASGSTSKGHSASMQVGSLWDRIDKDRGDLSEEDRTTQFYAEDPEGEHAGEDDAEDLETEEAPVEDAIEQPKEAPPAADLYRLENYRKTFCVGIRQKFGAKAQVCSYTRRDLSEEELKKLGQEAIGKLNAGQSLDAVKEWLNAQRP